MHSYKDFKRIAWQALPLGHAVSLPVPVMRNNALVDVVFSYVNDEATHIPSKPLLLIEANLDTKAAESREAKGAFPEVGYEPAPYVTIESYKEKSAEAKSLYGEVCEEVAEGKIGPASQRYAELVWSITQEPLRPYYRALSPTLFAACQ